MTASTQTLDLVSFPGAAPDPEATAGEQAYRANAYGLLGSLLRREPSAEVLRQVGLFGESGEGADDLATGMALLGLAARSTTPAQAETEFFRLFIGIGRGELVPFGSWYQTGFLMERPLGELRDDLRSLGFQRSDAVTEPEDHVAALCEVMLLLIEDATPLAEQKRFFERHMAPWVTRFFADLESADGAALYRAVGRFGKAFAAFENQYFAMPA